MLPYTSFASAISLASFWTHYKTAAVKYQIRIKKCICILERYYDFDIIPEDINPKGGRKFGYSGIAIFSRRSAGRKYYKSCGGSANENASRRFPEQLKDLRRRSWKTAAHPGEQKVTLTEDGMLHCVNEQKKCVDLMEKQKAELSSSNEISTEKFISEAGRNRCDFFCTGSRNIAERTSLIHYHIYSASDAGIVTEKIDKGLIDFGLLISPFDADKIRLHEASYEATHGGVLMQKAARWPKGIYLRGGFVG